MSEFLKPSGATVASGTIKQPVIESITFTGYAGKTGNANTWYTVYTNPLESNVGIISGSGVNRYDFFIDAELASKPTWATQTP